MIDLFSLLHDGVTSFLVLLVFLRTQRATPDRSRGPLCSSTLRLGASGRDDLGEFDDEVVVVIAEDVRAIPHGRLEIAPEGADLVVGQQGDRDRLRHLVLEEVELHALERAGREDLLDKRVALIIFDEHVGLNGDLVFDVHGVEDVNGRAFIEATSEMLADAVMELDLHWTIPYSTLWGIAPGFGSARFTEMNPVDPKPTQCVKEPSIII